MKKITKLAILPLLVAMSVGYAHAGSDDCLSKRAAIEYQISMAKAQGNYYKVARLQRALDKVNTYCSPDRQIQNLKHKIYKLERELREDLQDLREEQAKLQRAVAKGDLKKIAKYQREVAEEEAEVAETQRKLDYLRGQLANLQ